MNTDYRVFQTWYTFSPYVNIMPKERKHITNIFFSYCIKIVLNFKKIKDFSKIIKSDTINTNKLTLGGFFSPIIIELVSLSWRRSLFILEKQIFLISFNKYTSLFKKGEWGRIILPSSPSHCEYLPSELLRRQTMTFLLKTNFLSKQCCVNV